MSFGCVMEIRPAHNASPNGCECASRLVGMVSAMAWSPTASIKRQRARGCCSLRSFLVSFGPNEFPHGGPGQLRWPCLLWLQYQERVLPCSRKDQHRLDLV